MSNTKTLPCATPDGQPATVGRRRRGRTGSRTDLSSEDPLLIRRGAVEERDFAEALLADREDRRGPATTPGPGPLRRPGRVARPSRTMGPRRRVPVAGLGPRQRSEQQPAPSGDQAGAPTISAGSPSGRWGCRQPDAIQGARGSGVDHGREPVAVTATCRRSGLTDNRGPEQEAGGGPTGRHRRHPRPARGSRSDAVHDHRAGRPPATGRTARVGAADQLSGSTTSPVGDPAAGEAG